MLRKRGAVKTIGVFVLLAVLGTCALPVVFARPPVRSGKIVFGTGWKRVGKDLVIKGRKNSFRLNSKQTVVWIAYLKRNGAKGLDYVIATVSRHKVLGRGPVSKKAWGADELQSSASVKGFERQFPAMRKPGAFSLAYVLGKKTLAYGRFKFVK